MSGWNFKLVNRLINSVLLLSLIQPVLANDSGIDLELLEFLGEWETNEGEWVDPEQFEEEEEEEKEHGKTTK